MIKYNDILYAFSKTLKRKFNYKVDIKDNEEEVKEPIFFLSLSHLTSNSYLRWNEKSINVRIIYTNVIVDLEQLLDMQNELDELFDMYIKVGNANLVFDKKKFDRSNGFLTMTIPINYLDSKTNIPDQEKATAKMEILNYRDGDK